MLVLKQYKDDITAIRDCLASIKKDTKSNFLCCLPTFPCGLHWVNMKLNPINHFKTRELYFSSYLFAKGYELTAVELDLRGDFYWFIFQDKEKCEQEEKQFIKNEAIARAKDYAEAIKYLKQKVSQ